MANNKVVKAGFGYTIGNYLLKGISFLSVPIFARLLTQEDFGIYNTFLAYESILFVLLGLAIHTSYKNAKYKFDVEGAECTYYNYVSNTFVLLLVSLIIWLLLTLLFSKPLSNLLNLDKGLLFILVVYSYSTAIITCFNADVGLRYQYKSFLTVAGINAICNIGLSVLLVTTVFTNTRYVGRILGTVLPMFSLAIAINVRYLKRAKPHRIKESLSWGIRYSLPIVPHGISQVILTSFDRIMISNMIGSTEVNIPVR